MQPTPISLAFSRLIPIFEAIDDAPFQDRSRELVEAFRLRRQKCGLPPLECLEPLTQSPPIPLLPVETSVLPLQLHSDTQVSGDDISSSPSPERKPVL